MNAPRRARGGQQSHHATEWALSTNALARLAVIFVIALLVASPALSLEKALARVADRSEQGTWEVGTSCIVSYYNTCTGWIWVWGSNVFPDPTPWNHGDVLGIIYEPCCGTAILEATTTYHWTGADQPGYGFTGTIEVSTADASGCPDVLLAQQPYLPLTGPNMHVWGVPVAGSVVLTVTLASTMGAQVDVSVATDHPSAGPTGPPALGFCYPSPRTPHSFYYGNNVTGRNCPGSPLFDAAGNAEFVNWSAAFSCAVSVAEGMEFKSWGRVKSLYR